MLEQENLFYKSGEHRTSNTRVLDNGELVEYNCIEAEYRSVKRLHSSAPDLTVEPYFLKTDSNGNPEGYVMEYLEGTTLQQYLDPEGVASKEDLNGKKVGNQLSEFLNKIESDLEPHGDLKAWNIMIDEESNITVFDPVGYPENLDWERGELQKDRWNVEEIISSLEQEKILTV